MRELPVLAPAGRTLSPDALEEQFGGAEVIDRLASYFGGER